jgi:uncharacterized protein YbjT (DUF2867 family)
MSQTILVVGGTGNYGQFVCRQLAKDGFDVRVFTRKREKALRLLGEKFQIFEGNFEDDDSLRRALAGCDGVHLNLRGWWKDKSHYRNEHQGAVNVVRLAKEAGVQRLTSISDIHAREEYSFLPHLGAKVETEKVIRASGIPFAIFACSFFMENLHHLEKGDLIRVPFLDRSYHYLAAEDYARIVSRAYQAPAMPNQRIDLYGPELVHAHEMARRFCSIVRPQTRILTVPVWLMGIYMRLTGHLNRQYSVRVLRFYRKVGEVGDPSRADHSLGQPSIRFREWCEAQRPATAG